MSPFCSQDPISYYNWALSCHEKFGPGAKNGPRTVFAAKNGPRTVFAAKTWPEISGHPVDFTAEPRPRPLLIGEDIYYGGKWENGLFSLLCVYLFYYSHFSSYIA